MVAARTVLLASALCLASCQETALDTPLAASRRLPSLREASGVGSAEALDQESSLSRMLVAMVTRDLPRCSLLLAYNGDFGDSGVLRDVMALSNSRQVLHLSHAEDLVSVVWEASLCRGYIFLLQDLEPLLVFASMGDEPWDYSGRYVVVGGTKEELEALVTSSKGRKTEHIIGVTKSTRAGDWLVHTNGMYSERVIRRTNTWRSRAFTSPQTLFPDKLANLQGALLKVVTFEWEPSVLYYRNSNGTMTFPYGIDIEVVKALAEVYNFTIEYIEPPPGEFWGVLTDNGTWDGMVGKISRNEADMGVANLFLTLHRLGAVDYSAPYDAEVSCFMARTDPPAPRWKSLSLPFQLPTWLAMLVGLLVAGPVLLALAKANADGSGGEVKILQTVSFSFLYVFGMHFREPLQLMPQRTTTRIFILFLWLYTIIVTTAYNSNLTAFLTVVQAPSSMETVRELYGSGAEVSGLGGFFKGALASAVDPYLQALAERFIAYNELNVVWPNVQSGESVYLHNRQFLEFVITTQFTRKGVTSMRIMKECFAPYNIAMALQRHSPLKRKFDKAIRWMLESGLVRRWFLESLRLSRKAKEQKGGSDDTNSEGETEQIPSSGVIPLSIDHMQGAFFVIVFGNVLAFLVFLVENCCRKGARKEKEGKEELGLSSSRMKSKAKMVTAHA